MKRILFVLALLVIGIAWAGGVTLANLEDRPNDELAGVDFAANVDAVPPYVETEAALPVPVKAQQVAQVCGPNGCSSSAVAGYGGPMRRMFARRGPLRRGFGWVNSHRPRLLGRLFGRGRGGC